jgi:spore cortex biosynthesis protein YabQ
MISPVDAQFLSLLISLFAGIMIGLLFDLYRTLNFYCKPNKKFVNFMDLLFWIITLGVVFALLLNADFAEIRFYTFLGMAIGVAIYLGLFSFYVLKIYRMIFYIIAKAFRIIFIFITLPFKLIRGLIWSLNGSIKKLFNETHRGLKKFYLKLIRKKK